MKKTILAALLLFRISIAEQSTSPSYLSESLSLRAAGYPLSMMAYNPATKKYTGVSFNPSKDGGSVDILDENQERLATVWKDGFVSGNTPEVIRRLVIGCGLLKPEAK
jgi:hypothetical protein